MEKYFVTRYIAYELSQIGFNEPCIAIFRGYDSEPVSQTCDVFTTKINSLMLGISSMDGYWLARPMYSQVFDWLRRVHNIDAWVQPFCLENTNGDRVLPDESYSYFIFKDGELIKDQVFLEPEDAEAQCIIDAIELIKSLKK